MDFTKFFTNTTNRRKSSILCEWVKLCAECENGINLANGMPNANMFPFEEIAITYKSGRKVKLVGEELHSSLQYGPSQGHLRLIEKMREFQEHWRKPMYNHWDLLFTAGSMDGCSKIFEMFLEVEDPVMVQVPAYNGILNALAPLIPEFIEITQDQDGIIPENIRNICEGRIRDGKTVPKILYVNPTGANPTGTVLTESRRRDIYQLAETYDFLILEDDPYCFIHFMEKNPTTFFELDSKGRVIRLDSFSKILSAGLRLGVVTAHKKIIQKLTLHMEATSLHACSMSQMLLFKLLETWSLQKLQQHFTEIQQFYRNRRDTMLSLMEKHLTGLVEWNVPAGGMFVWIKINDIKDIVEFVRKKCISQGIFVVHGQAFYYNRSRPSQYLRLSYSYATLEQIDKALSILATLIRKETGK